MRPCFAETGESVAEAPFPLRAFAAQADARKSVVRRTRGPKAFIDNPCKFLVELRDCFDNRCSSLSPFAWPTIHYADVQFRKIAQQIAVDHECVAIRALCVALLFKTMLLGHDSPYLVQFSRKAVPERTLCHITTVVWISISIIMVLKVCTPPYALALQGKLLLPHRMSIDSGVTANLIGPCFALANLNSH